LYQKEQGHIHTCVCVQACIRQYQGGKVGARFYQEGRIPHSPKASRASNNMFINIFTYDNSYVHTLSSELYVLSQFPYISVSGIRYVILFNPGNSYPEATISGTKKFTFISSCISAHACIGSTVCGELLFIVLCTRCC
jgi:hypothetical protein